MRRTTVVSAEGDAAASGGGSASGASAGHGTLKLFFSYAPFTGTTTALLDELQGMEGRGKDVFLAELTVPSTGKVTGQPFDIDQVLKRCPDLVALDDFAAANPAGSRNRWRYQDALELLHAGIDVYAVLRVSNLKNERDRVQMITGRKPASVVPDRIFYNAQQVEFVDIDPQELAERSEMAGRSHDSIDVLRQLRSLALECVSFYASSSSRPAGGQLPGDVGPHEKVAALVGPGAAPDQVILEAQRLANMVHAPLQVVCVRRERRVRGEADDDLATQLSEQVDALGFELVTLWGNDALQTLGDYLRLQGVTDIVLSKGSLPRLRSLLDRRALAHLLEGGVAGARVHVVPGTLPPASARRALAGGLATLLDFRASDLAFTAAAVVVSLAVASLLVALDLGSVNTYLVYLLASTVVAARTRSYVPTLLAVVASCLVERFVVYPAAGLAFDGTGTVTYVLMVAVMLLVTFSAVSMGRSAERSRQREQHTQALFELSRNLGFARGTKEVVDISLDALVRLFGRSAAFYTSDPLGRRRGGGKDGGALAVRDVDGDLDAAQFRRANERAIAHWVFGNGAEAGAGTITSDTSDIYYLPLRANGSLDDAEAEAGSLASDPVIGVIAISCRRPLSAGERSFLERVAKQVFMALERQSLAASHLRDMQNLQVGVVRNRFITGLVASSNLSAGVISDLSRTMRATRDDEVDYRETLERLIGLEASRERVMCDRMNESVIDVPTRPTCDLHREVEAAVAKARQGRDSTVIELEASEDIPALVADGAMLRTATSLVLDASLLFAPVGDVISVGVRLHPGFAVVSVADNRPDALAGPPAAFGRDYDEERARSLLAYLGKRDTATLASDEGARALARALRVPVAACAPNGSVDFRRLSRADSTQYGLYMAALIVRAHNGEIKMRHRLGGGAVTTFTLPVD